MGRAPCCEKTGLKRGPWTPQEDNILISFIHHHGHPNWRSLPKQAGLLRCGKSCRLRWTNYLRPDIKRGNFTPDEERTIIRLHQILGNRWSIIASRLPGRTDNEIKNVWHTRLKKKLYNDDLPPPESKPANNSSHEYQIQYEDTKSSSSTEVSNQINNINGDAAMELVEESLFWSEDLESFSWSPPMTANIDGDHQDLHELEQGMDFWYNLFINAGELTPQLI